MKKQISVMDPTELEIKFEDGKVINLIFDVKSLTGFNNVEGGFSALLNEKSIPELCARIIYATGTEHNEGLDLQKAREMVSRMDILTLGEIMNEFNESIGTSKNEVQKELQKKLMAQYTQEIMK
jgi:hypothetical protein